MPAPTGPRPSRGRAGRGDKVFGVGLYLGIGIAIGAACLPLAAQPPERNLLVQVRFVDAAGLQDASASRDAATAATGFTVSTVRPGADGTATQSLLVRNGERGAIRFAASLPFQWAQAAGARQASRGSSGASPGASSGTSASISGGGVVNAVTWLPAGQGLGVRARWPGGKSLVALDIDVDDAQVQPRLGAALPASLHRQMKTTVLVPLGQWVTVATVAPTVAPSRPGEWSSRSAGAEPPQAFQVLVREP